VEIVPICDCTAEPDTGDPLDTNDSSDDNADVRVASLVEPKTLWISEMIELTIDDVSESLPALWRAETRAVMALSNEEAAPEAPDAAPVADETAPVAVETAPWTALVPDETAEVAAAGTLLTAPVTVDAALVAAAGTLLTAPVTVEAALEADAGTLLTAAAAGATAAVPVDTALEAAAGTLLAAPVTVAPALVAALVAAERTPLAAERADVNDWL